MIEKLPPYYNYKEEGTDNGYETMQDFILSWTLRCSVDNLSSINSKLQQYSKGVLLSLISRKVDGFNDFDEVIVKSVKTKRQWNYIDLLAEVVLEIEGIDQNYILNIENKWYSSIISGQLEKSRISVNNNYSKDNYNIINAIIFCDYEKLNDEVREKCEKEGYEIFVIEDLKENAEMIELTENYLFDEYWFRF